MSRVNDAYRRRLKRSGDVYSLQNRKDILTGIEENIVKILKNLGCRYSESGEIMVRAIKILKPRCRGDVAEYHESGYFKHGICLEYSVWHECGVSGLRYQIFLPRDMRDELSRCRTIQAARQLGYIRPHRRHVSPGEGATCSPL